MEDKMINGLDVDAFEKTCALIKKQPQLGVSQFRIINKWKSAGNNQVTVKGFYAAGKEQAHASTFTHEVDEPTVLLSTDKGASPVEYLLTALSSCMTTSIIYHAAARGYKIEALESDFEGDLDLRGFLDIGENIPKGYTEIRATFRVKTDASEEDIAALYKFSPVYSMVSAGVSIKVNVVKV